MLPAGVLRFADVDSLSRAAAERIVEIGCEAVRARGKFSIALSGGSTPRNFFEQLTLSPLVDKLDWRRVQFFWGDERTVPPDHPDSNYRMANELLLTRLPGLEQQQIHRMEAEREDLESAAKDYESTLARILGDDPDDPSSPPALDLVLLGIGPDAHTASLFPETEALQPTQRYVVANFVPKLSAWRMTLTPHIINAARHVLFVIAGGDKAQALHAILCDPEAKLPSQLIRPNKGQLEWMIDPAAGERLDSPNAS